MSSFWIDPRGSPPRTGSSFPQIHDPRNALRSSSGDVSILFSSVICWVLIALCIVGILSPIFMNKLEKKAEEEATGVDPDDKKPIDLDVDND